MPTSPLPAQPLAGRLAGPRPHVLVIEDEPDIATFLAAFFRASGMELDHLAPESVDEVTAHIEASRPGCVLLDLRLGPISGFEVLLGLRERDLLPSLPVVVLSATDAATNRERALQLGAVDFLSKPFSVRDVFALVSRLVGAPAPTARPHHVAASAARPGVPSPLDVLLDSEDLAVRVAVAVRKARLDGMPVACALVWADGASDRIDAIAASIIRTSTRSEAIRTGSADEVAIVAHEHDAARLADILSAAVADVGLGFGIALKAGVAAAPEHASDGPALLAAARRALTAAISRGPVATAR